MTKTIMTVDDSPSMRMLLRAALTDLGYNVVEAEDGVHALETLQNFEPEEEPDLLITDINMPRMDGFGLIEQVRADGRRSLPILVLTTESSEEKKQRARDAGATGWIVKPFHPEKLAAAIRRVLH
ncbi:response regulator [Sphingomonas citri]|uniref:Response regulator n=1 Tax=Sphingomonas citri TaxID=2862499 RepID=A0ABS7BQW4_9SPHN|nr:MULTISPECIES: response regulator [Sphingomonas]MBB3345836.1 two-component system chemotaxis response regulator CheY [Sphingomonas sp. BK069]MBB3474569.1 two-component system chemotaxis response regulator CheY [Sphingomonas sp. BK345]MBW6531992.1 response regulator [Sphingomonas citri]